MARASQQQQNDTPEPETPPTRTYRILVTKLGHEHSDWVEGKEVEDSAAPALDWDRLVRIGAVALVREDGTVALPPDALPPRPAPTASEAQDAQPATTSEYHGGPGSGAGNPDGSQGQAV